MATPKLTRWLLSITTLARAVSHTTAPTRLQTRCESFARNTVYRAALGMQLGDALACRSIPTPLDVQHRAVPWACYRSERLEQRLQVVRRGYTRSINLNDRS